VCVLRTLVLATDADWLARRFHLPTLVAKGLRRAAFRTSSPGGALVDAPPSGLDDLWARVVAASDIRNGVVRDSAWWAWRYERSPLGPYRYVEVREAGRLQAAAVVAEREDFGGRFGYVLELLAVEPSAAHAAVATAANDIAGVVGLVTQVMGGSALDRLSRAGGLRRLPRRLEPKTTRFGIADHTGTLGSVDDWHVGWGDQDHL
jgi:hypothetical protein